jgi:hypothetical protein
VDYLLALEGCEDDRIIGSKLLTHTVPDTAKKKAANSAIAFKK